MPAIDLSGSSSNDNSQLQCDNSLALKSWRYATEEEKREYEKRGKPYDVTTIIRSSHKFKVGDRVKVVVTGRGVGSHDRNTICTISELGKYTGGPGYRVKDPAIGNSLDGMYDYMIGEETFELVASMEDILAEAKTKFQEGDLFKSVNEGIQGTHKLTLPLRIKESRIVDASGAAVYREGIWATVDKSITPTAETLEEAKRRYPKGTKYMSANPGSAGKWVVEGSLIIADKERITDNNGGSVYWRGQWATIVSLPEVKEVKSGTALTGWATLEEPYTEAKVRPVAVELPYKFQWDHVFKYLTRRGAYSDYGERSCVSVTTGTYGTRKDYEASKEGFEIISFREWCNRYNHPFEFEDKTLDGDKIKKGDTVEIVNLFNHGMVGNLNGTLGHRG